MLYHERRKAIEDAPLTQLPALFALCVRECFKRRVFRPGGLIRTATAIEREFEAAACDPRMAPMAPMDAKRKPCGPLQESEAEMNRQLEGQRIQKPPEEGHG